MEVDGNDYVTALKAQRNAALDEAATLRAALDKISREKVMWQGKCEAAQTWATELEAKLAALRHADAGPTDVAERAPDGD